MKIWICIGALTVILAGPWEIFAQSIVLITHPQNPVSQIEKDEVKKIFLGKTSRWDHGRPIHVFLHDREETHAAFLGQFVNKTPRQFFLFWKRALFSGTGAPPPSVEDDEAMKEAVSSSTGSLGYIRASSLDSSVKVLEVH